MRHGRPKADLTLDEVDREILDRCSRRPRAVQAPALRSRVILKCADGSKWRPPFLDRAVVGLLDEARPGAPRKISDAAIERPVTMTLESTLADATHWSTRSVTKAGGRSQSTVSRVCRALALRPHRMERIKLSTDPLFVEKLRDIVGLYMDPPECLMVLCVDEHSQIQGARPHVTYAPDAARPGRAAHA